MARRLVYHHRRLDELDPDYDDCPLPCAESKEDEPGLCEECPVRESYEKFRGGAEEEINQRCPGALKKWSFENLQADVTTAFSQDASVRGRGYPRRCTTLEASLINIVRAARHKVRRVDSFNREQEAKAKGK